MRHHHKDKDLSLVTANYNHKVNGADDAYDSDNDANRNSRSEQRSWQDRKHYQETNRKQKTQQTKTKLEPSLKWKNLKTEEDTALYG